MSKSDVNNSHGRSRRHFATEFSLSLVLIISCYVLCPVCKHQLIIALKESSNHLQIRTYCLCKLQTLILLCWDFVCTQATQHGSVTKTTSLNPAVVLITLFQLYFHFSVFSTSVFSPLFWAFEKFKVYTSVSLMCTKWYLITST